MPIATMTLGWKLAVLSVKFRRLHDERVAVPVAACVTHPLPQVVRHVWASVQRDDARVVHHLVEDDDVAGSLDQVHVLVVATREHRRAGIESEEASLGEAAIFWSVDGGSASAVPDWAVARKILDQRAGLMPCVIPEARHASIGWVDDQRRASVADDTGSSVEPENCCSRQRLRRRRPQAAVQF